MSERPVGKTKDAGWQIGVSRTIAVGLDAVWEYLTSSEGLAVWLGPGVETPLRKGQAYRTDDGTIGEIRSLRPLDRVRLTWRPANRADHATIQIALAPAKTGCTVRFHSERLRDSDEREKMREHWKTVANAIEAELLGEP